MDSPLQVSITETRENREPVINNRERNEFVADAAFNHNKNKILEFDWLSIAMITALKAQCTRYSFSSNQDTTRYHDSRIGSFCVHESRIRCAFPS